MAEHTIDPTIIHHRWIKDLEPALRIQSGDTVNYDLMVAGDPNIAEGQTAEQARFDWETIYNLSGPLYVEGAEPGDTLEIELLSLQPGDWGWAAILPDLGLLEEFRGPLLKTIDIRNGEYAQLCDGVRIPLSPFLGTMGNHPSEPDGELRSRPTAVAATWTTAT